MSRILGLAALSLVVAACGQAEKAAETAKNEAAEAVINSQLKAEGLNATVQVGSADALKNMPSYLPAYPGAEVVSSMLANEEGRQGGMIAFRTKDDPAKVAEFYRKKIADAGQTIAMDMNTQGAQMLIVEGGDSETGGMVTIAKDGEEGTNVSIAFGQN